MIPLPVHVIWRKRGRGLSDFVFTITQFVTCRSISRPTPERSTAEKSSSQGLGWHSSSHYLPLLGGSITNRYLVGRGRPDDVLLQRSGICYSFGAPLLSIDFELSFTAHCVARLAMQSVERLKRPMHVLARSACARPSCKREKPLYGLQSTENVFHSTEMVFHSFKVLRGPVETRSRCMT